MRELENHQHSVPEKIIKSSWNSTLIPEQGAWEEIFALGKSMLDQPDCLT